MRVKSVNKITMTTSTIMILIFSLCIGCKFDNGTVTSKGTEGSITTELLESTSSAINDNLLVKADDSSQEVIGENIDTEKIDEREDINDEPIGEVKDLPIQQEPSVSDDRLISQPSQNQAAEVEEDAQEEVRENIDQEEDIKESESPSREPVEEPKTKEPTVVSTSTESTPEAEKIESEVLPDHSNWNALLSTYVSATGNVNYKGLSGKISELDAYLSWLASNAPGASDKSQKAKAYWINAYNAFTVKLILDNYPIASITDIAGGKPWDKKWIKLGNKTYSLNDIEHGIIRPVWKDARIHFAVNCAAKSCPPLVNKAYTSDNIDGLLEKATKSFINNQNYNTIGAGQTKLSKIFEWYNEDFGDLITYINRYSSTKVKPNAQVGFIDYNWALNGN